jgi:hypothetical protein
MTDPTDWCVMFSQTTRQLMTGRKEEVLNLNASALLDAQPGFAIVRMDMTRDQAERYARSLAPVVSIKQKAAA